jgi:hypothetical protein
MSVDSNLEPADRVHSLVEDICSRLLLLEKNTISMERTCLVAIQIFGRSDT